jgi:PHD/YefM family antitoxin component YafN of YafNO toxin-antitoxin module
MRQFTSTEAKQHFGELLKAAEHGPVAVERHRKVQAIVLTPAHFAAMQAQPDRQAERRIARLQQAVAEHERLIRHQRIAIDLLSLPSTEQKQLIDKARATVAFWQADTLCSSDYVQRWSDILAQPAPQIARLIVDELDGWGPALRRNSPWIGDHAP